MAYLRIACLLKLALAMKPDDVRHGVTVLKSFWPGDGALVDLAMLNSWLSAHTGRATTRLFLLCGLCPYFASGPCGGHLRDLGAGTYTAMCELCQAAGVHSKATAIKATRARNDTEAHRQIREVYDALTEDEQAALVEKIYGAAALKLQ